MEEASFKKVSIRKHKDWVQDEQHHCIYIGCQQKDQQWVHTGLCALGNRCGSTAKQLSKSHCQNVEPVMVSYSKEDSDNCQPEDQHTIAGNKDAALIRRKESFSQAGIMFLHKLYRRLN